MKIRFKVKSSAIASVAYDISNKEMKIAFTSNPAKDYDFYNVPPHIVCGLMKTDSVGRYYHANIRGKFNI